mgnify:CR=1 FL=1
MNKICFNLNIKKNRIVLLFATWFYIGNIKIAPGTFGTIGAIPLIYILKKTSFEYYIIFLIIFIGFSIYISHKAEKIFNKKDAGNIVIDEVVGYLVTMIFINFQPMEIFLGLLVFRLFDILKPFPINKLQNIKGGIGVVIDDVVAGIFSSITLSYLIFFIKTLFY